MKCNGITLEKKRCKRNCKGKYCAQHKRKKKMKGGGEELQEKFYTDKLNRLKKALEKAKRASNFAEINRIKEEIREIEFKFKKPSKPNFQTPFPNFAIPDSKRKVEMSKKAHSFVNKKTDKDVENILKNIKETLKKKLSKRNYMISQKMNNTESFSKLEKEIILLNRQVEIYEEALNTNNSDKLRGNDLKCIYSNIKYKEVCPVDIDGKYINGKDYWALCGEDKDDNTNEYARNSLNECMFKRIKFSDECRTHTESDEGHANILTKFLDERTKCNKYLDRKSVPKFFRDENKCRKMKMDMGMKCLKFKKNENKCNSNYDWKKNKNILDDITECNSDTSKYILQCVDKNIISQAQIDHYIRQIEDAQDCKEQLGILKESQKKKNIRLGQRKARRYKFEKRIEEEKKYFPKNYNNL